MSTTQVSIRLGVEGKAEVKRAFEEVGQAGTQAFGQVDRALEKTGAATDRETARFKRLAEAARMAVQADAAQGRFNQVLGVDRQAAGSARASAEVFEQAAREAERYEARARALRATLDPLAAALDRLNAELAEHAALASRGAITTAEQAAANALAKSRFEQTAQAIKGVGANSKLTTQQVMTLQYTFNDVVASMSTGMSPMTILMQQGGQVTQAFGGLRGTLAAIGKAVDRAVDGRNPSEELDLLKWQRDRLRENIRGNVVPLMLPQVERRIAEIEAQLAEQQRRAAQLAAEARANELSVRAGETARDIIPGARDLERLRREQATLRAALDDPLTRSKLNDVAEVEAAYRRVTAELARFRPAVDAATQAVVAQSSVTEVSIRSTLALANAYLESASAAERAEARKTGLIEQAREGIDAEARARHALRERIAEQAATAARQVADLTAEASAQKRVNDAVAAGSLASAKAS